jgi:hypothetical protein
MLGHSPRSQAGIVLPDQGGTAMTSQIKQKLGWVKALVALLATLAVTGTGLVGLGTAASARPAGGEHVTAVSDESEVAVDGAVVAAAPSCVRVRHTVGNVTQTVYVKNNCHQTVSWLVKINGDDGPCKITRPGREGKFKWTRFAAFQGIKWHCI